MKKKNLIKEFTILFENKKLTEKTPLSELNFDSLKILEILSFADKKFPKLNIEPDKLYKCKKIEDIVKLFKIER